MVTMLFVVAAILLFAIYRKRDVTFSFKWLGAHLTLEAKDSSERQSIHRPVSRRAFRKTDVR
jgi:hypothetical protein